MREKSKWPKWKCLLHLLHRRPLTSLEQQELVGTVAISKRRSEVRKHLEQRGRMLHRRYRRGTRLLEYWHGRAAR